MASPGVVTLVIGQIRCAIIHRRHAPCTLHPQVGRRGAARSGPLVGAPHQRPAPATTAARALAAPHAQPAQPSTLLARPRIISGAGDGDGDGAAAPVKLFWPISLARPTRPAYPPPVQYDGSLLLTSRTSSHSGQTPARDRPRRPLPLLGAVRLARDDSARTPFSRHLSCTAPALLPDLLACTVAATTAAALQPSQPEPYGTHLPSAQSHAFPDLHHHPDPPDAACQIHHAPTRPDSARCVGAHVPASPFGGSVRPSGRCRAAKRDALTPVPSHPLTLTSSTAAGRGESPSARSAPILAF